MKDKEQWEILPALVNLILDQQKVDKTPGATYRWWTGLRALKGENGLVTFEDISTKEGKLVIYSHCTGTRPRQAQVTGSEKMKNDF